MNAIRIAKPTISAVTISFRVLTTTNLGVNAGELGAPG